MASMERLPTQKLGRVMRNNSANRLIGQNSRWAVMAEDVPALPDFKRSAANRTRPKKPSIA
jgi:hypothetical protein